MGPSGALLQKSPPKQQVWVADRVQTAASRCGGLLTSTHSTLGATAAAGSKARPAASCCRGRCPQGEPRPTATTDGSLLDAGGLPDRKCGARQRPVRPPPPRIRKRWATVHRMRATPTPMMPHKLQRPVMQTASGKGEGGADSCACTSHQTSRAQYCKGLDAMERNGTQLNEIEAADWPPVRIG